METFSVFKTGSAIGPLPLAAEQARDAVPAEFIAADDALAAIEDDDQQHHGEDYHSHARHAGDREAADVHVLFHKAQPFEQRGDDHGADGGAGDGAEPAGYHDHQDIKGELEVEHFGVDGGNEAAHQRTADASEERADGEGDGFVAEGVDAHGAGRHLVVADGPQTVAKVAGQQFDDHIKGERAPEIVPAEVGVGGNALEPQRAVGDRGDVGKDDADDLRETERGDAQVVAAEPQHRQGDHQPQQRRGQAAGQHRDKEGRMHDGERPDDWFQDVHHFLLRGRQNQQRAHVGAHCHETRVSEREQAREAVDEVEADGEDGVDGDQVQHLHLVAVEVAAGPPEKDRQQRQRDDVEEDLLRFLHILSSSFSPIRPVGFTNRMRISSTKAKASR